MGEIDRRAQEMQQQEALSQAAARLARISVAVSQADQQREARKNAEEVNRKKAETLNTLLQGVIIHSYSEIRDLRTLWFLPHLKPAYLQKDKDTKEPTIVCEYGFKIKKRLHVTYDPEKNVFLVQRVHKTPDHFDSLQNTKYKGFWTNEGGKISVDPKYIDDFMKDEIAKILIENKKLIPVRAGFAAVGLAAVFGICSLVTGKAKAAEMEQVPDQDQPAATEQHLEL